ncbi:hypothetical protein DRO97_02085 [Archaeoglobales archaeon]|mgnify:CR=1 FL=1|nr:MAG: hypothetical protein DRO97_02085 [Archaeoglobales archaeon]
MNRKAYFLPMLIFGLVLLGCVSKEEHASTPQLQTPQLQTEQKQVYNKADKIEHKELKPENIHFSEVGEVKEPLWIRFWISWEMVEKEKGKYDFTLVDEIVRDFEYRNTLILITVMPFASWDQDICHGEEYYSDMPFPFGMQRLKVGKPCNMQAYREFLKKLVERYDGDGVEDMPALKYPIKYWEIMNEPEMQGKDLSGLKFFVGTPQEYLEILKVSYETIKEADPEAKVLMAGMAGMHQQFVKFWEPIIGKAENYFDIANIHSIDTNEKREDLFVIKFKRFLERHSVDKPVWVTEAQFGDLMEKPKDIRKIDELLVKSSVFSLSLGAEKIFFVGNWLEFWRSESTQKAYEIMVKKLNRFEKLEVIKQEYVENERDYEGATSLAGIHKFTVENKPVYVIWGNVELPKEIKGKIKVTDIYGNEKIMYAINFTSSDSPVYVEIIDY